MMLRTVAGALVAAAVGIHCSAPTDDIETAPVEVSELPERAERARPAPAEGDVTEAPERTDPSLPDISSLVTGGSAPVVTSSAIDARGSMYVTGTFVGVVGLGATRAITSRGDKDVFLLKLDARGGVEWVRAVGSQATESAPRVALEGDEVALIGMTKGQVNCGSGPLPRLPTKSFFLCMFGDRDGALLNGGVFPTGSP